MGIREPIIGLILGISLVLFRLIALPQSDSVSKAIMLFAGLIIGFSFRRLMNCRSYAERRNAEMLRR